MRKDFSIRISDFFAYFISFLITILAGGEFALILSDSYIGRTYQTAFLVYGLVFLGLFGPLFLLVKRLVLFFYRKIYKEIHPWNVVIELLDVENHFQSIYLLITTYAFDRLMQTWDLRLEQPIYNPSVKSEVSNLLLDLTEIGNPMIDEHTSFHVLLGTPFMQKITTKISFLFFKMQVNLGSFLQYQIMAKFDEKGIAHVLNPEKLGIKPPFQNQYECNPIEREQKTIEN